MAAGIVYIGRIFLFFPFLFLLRSTSRSLNDFLMSFSHFRYSRATGWHMVKQLTGLYCRSAGDVPSRQSYLFLSCASPRWTVTSPCKRKSTRPFSPFMTYCTKSNKGKAWKRLNKTVVVANVTMFLMWTVAPAVELHVTGKVCWQIPLAFLVTISNRWDHMLIGFPSLRYNGHTKRHHKKKRKRQKKPGQMYRKDPSMKRVRGRAIP